MKCSIHCWIFPSSMPGCLRPRLLNFRLRVCYKKLRRHSVRQRETKACVYVSCEVIHGYGATLSCLNGYCSIWYPMPCDIRCEAGSSSDLVGVVKCYVSKYGVAVPASLRI